MPKTFFSSLTLLLIGALVVPLTGCSTLNVAERTHQALSEVAEADRYYNLGDVAKGRQWLETAVDLIPDAPAVYMGQDELLGVAEVARRNGDYTFLISLLEKQLKQPKLADSWDIYEKLGDAYEYMGNIPARKEAYSKAYAALLRVFPSVSARTPLGNPVRLEKAQCEWKMGSIPASKTDFDAVIRLESDFASWAQNTEAYSMAQDGVDLGQAESLSQESIKAAILAGGDDEEEVVAEFQDTLAWIYYGQWLQSKDPATLAKAITNEELALGGFPEETDIHNHLAQMYEAAGRNADASIEYGHVANMLPADPRPRAESARLAGIADTAGNPRLVTDSKS